MENEIIETTAETVMETTEVLETTVETLETVPATTEEYVEATEATAEVVVEFIESTTPAVESITVQQLYEVGDAIVHADLFGSFLVCGAIMALALFRRFK